MFSPSVNDGGPATATRSRRRQRPLSSESIAQPKAKRQRLPLTEQTFVNPEVPPQSQPQAQQQPLPSQRGRRDRDSIEVKTEKATTHDPRKEDLENHHTPRRDQNVRAKKTKHGDRAANKGDGSLVLTSTNAYTVSKLPALPDQIRSDWTANQHGEIVSSFGYALALTPTHALVWPYTSTSQSPETFSFTLPSGSRTSDPLPVGCLVSPSAASTEPGLVVIMAGTGKVVYWESISSAATFAFIKKDRSGVEHTINGMTSGEKVVDITNAESAGFILSFNTGRLAYLNVRDNHGRPAISVQFIRSGLSSSGSGFFGSIRHAFSHLSLRGDIAAVRADRFTRVGEKNIVALSSKGRLQAWKIHRGGHSEHLGEEDMRDEIAVALHEADPISQDFPSDSLEAIDFTFVPKGLEAKYLELSRLSNAMESEDPSVQHLLLLVSLTKSRTSRYALVEVILTPNGCQTGMVRPITSYSSPVEQSDVAQPVRPRLYLPRPALVAFIIFERAAVIASVAVPPESPDSQLQSDNHMVPPSFEDVIDFREDKVHEILGSGFEETPIATSQEEARNQRHKNKNPSAILFVRGAGIIRVLTTDVDKFASDKPPVVTAKSKLEQAVFFGAKHDNPLVFDGRKDIKFSNEEMGNAALEVSHEILSSSTSYISTLPAHLEENLQARSYALERLTDYLRVTGANLDRKTRWSLLFNAERMHVAALLWKRHEAFTASRSPDDKKTLIGLIVEFIHDDQKHKPRAKIGEVDAVRHWFINDVYRLEFLVAWAYEVIKLLHKDRLLDDAKATVMMHEAMQIYMCSHTAAMEFRKTNLSRYGLEDEELRHGVLRSGYENLPEPWTATDYGANNQRRLLDLSSNWVNDKWLAEEKPAQTGPPADPKVLEKIYNDLPTLTECVLASLLEQARFAKTAANGTRAQDFANDYAKDRDLRPRALAQVGHWEQAARIAKKFGSLDALAAILLDHVEKLEGEIAEPGLSPLEQQSLRSQRESKKSELQADLAEFGAGFAFPLYEYLLEKHGVGAVLDYDLDLLGFKTKFLRSKPELAKISWINDVQTEEDVHQAADTLVGLALTKEQQVWNKKIELSLGKLALLAEAESSNHGFDSLQPKADVARRDETISQVDRALVAIKIQDEVYNHVVPSTYEAVDQAAALNFAMETYSTNIPRRQKALHQIFEDGMGRLLRRESLDAMTLIDLLTLMSGTSDALSAHPFCHALRVADICCHSDEAKDAKALIWRRLFIRDDWPKLNDTQLKDDTEVSSRLGDTELYATLIDCVRAQDPRNPFQPMQPQHALGAFVNGLDRRFRNFDSDFQAKLRDAMKWEDKTLSQYIERNRVAMWLEAILDAARRDVQAELDEATAADAAAATVALEPVMTTNP